MKRRILFLLPLLAGIAAAIVLTIPSVARAWDINALPDGYHVDHVAGDCPAFVVWTVYSTETVSLHTCVPGWTDTLDAYVEATCPQAVCHPVTTTSSSTAPVTTTAPAVTDTSATTTTVPPVTVPTTTTVPAPQTVTVTTVIVDPSITSRLDLIEQRQATDEARITQLEHPAVPGLAPLGEPKNVLPFVTS